MQKVATLQSYLSRFTALLSLILALSILLYGTLLLFAVSHTAARASAQRQMQDISSEISLLESSYFEATRAITPELAAQMGFTQPLQSTTVFANAANKSLTLEGLRQE